jgi:ATP-dependent phosphoenolpyruvate carboxykinase
MSSFNLQQHEIAVEKIHRNLPPSALYEHAILYEKDAHIAENGALVAYSGVKTGRSPKDKRVVKQTPSENDECDPVFGLDVVTKCPNVPSEILVPRNVWSDKAAYEAAATKLASLFANNFATYEGGVSAEVKAAGPNV